MFENVQDQGQEDYGQKHVKRGHIFQNFPKLLQTMTKYKYGNTIFFLSYFAYAIFFPHEAETFANSLHLQNLHGKATHC